MKKDTAIIKNLTVVAIVLMVVALSIIAFIGVFTKNLNKISNVVPDYTFSSEFEGAREYSYVLDTSEEEKEVYIDESGNVKGYVVTSENKENNEVAENVEEVQGYNKEKRTIKANDESALTPESYKKSRAIIEKRLEAIGATEYTIRLDEVNGNLVVELPDDKNTDFIAEVVNAKGEFSIIDSQNGLELMDNSYIKSAKAVYNTNTSQVYLDLQLNKKGKEVLNDISGKYIQTEVKNEENSESAEETKKETKYVEIKVDGTTILKTYFDGAKDWSSLQIPIGSYTTVSELQDYLKSAQAYSTIINCGEMPNSYSLKNNDFKKSVITEKDKLNIRNVLILSVVIFSVILMVKFGSKGLLGAILNLGYLAVVSLALKYTGVVITISSIFAAIFLIILNFVFMYKVLKVIKKDGDNKKIFNETCKNFYLEIIPIFIISFVFSYMASATIVGIGMVLFWGLVIELLYNFVFTKKLYE